MDTAQKQYDEIMKGCPMEFRGYTSEKYEWDKQHVNDYYTMWEREDIFLTKHSLKRCKQWEKKHDLEHFKVLDDREKSMNSIKQMEERENYFATKERLNGRKKEMANEGRI